MRIRVLMGENAKAPGERTERETVGANVGVGILPEPGSFTPRAEIEGDALFPIRTANVRSR